MERKPDRLHALDDLGLALRSGAYRTSPARRKLIPKPGKPGQFRPLGIPTAKNRVVQGAIKLHVLNGLHSFKRCPSRELRPISDAGIALARLDERIGRSAVGAGFLERAHFVDACGSLWIDGELVHLEDLVLHDAIRHIRTPPTN